MAYDPALGYDPAMQAQQSPTLPPLPQQQTYQDAGQVQAQPLAQTPTLPAVPGTEGATAGVQATGATAGVQSDQYNAYQNTGVVVDPGPGGPMDCPNGTEFIANIGCMPTQPGPVCEDPDNYYYYMGMCYPRSGYQGGLPGGGTPVDPISLDDPRHPDYGYNPYDPNNPTWGDDGGGNTPGGDPNCGPGLFMNENGECVDFDEFVGGGNDPECPPGFTPYMGFCRDDATGQCYNDQMQKVACDDSVGPSDPTECLQGEVWNGTSCVPDDNITEGCQPGFTMDANGVCQPNDGTGTEPPDTGPVPCIGDNGNVGVMVNGQCVEQGGTTPPGYEPDLDHDPLDLPPGSPDPDYTGTDIDAQPFNYDEVRDYIDAAFEDAMRYIEPQEQFENERHVQQLINQGIDPNSPAGIKALQRLQMGQNDRRSKATYDAIASGMAAREQMFGEGLSQAELDQQVGLALNELEQRGYEFDTRALLEYDKNAWSQLMDVNNHLFDIYQSYVEQENWEMAMAILLAGGPGGITLDPTQ